MTRLSHELHRLGLSAAADASTTDALRDAAGRWRCLVLDLQAPADWRALARVWQGVQAELDLPAPAIVVSGGAGVQLWFALQQALPADEGAAVLQALVQRWLADVPPHRLRLYPGTPDWRPPAVPALQGEDRDGQRWSAFVAADLAPMFSDTPWLDIPPGPDGQAALLARLQPVAPDALARALAALRPVAAAPGPASMAAGDPPAGPAVQPVVAAAPLADAVAPGACTDPRQFLLAVMNDAAVPMALRIEAAKALLPGR